MNFYECETLKIGKLSCHKSSKLAVNMNEVTGVEQSVRSAQFGIQAAFVHECVCVLLI